MVDRDLRARFDAARRSASTSGCLDYYGSVSRFPLTLFFAALVLSMLLIVLPAGAVIFDSTGDPGYNTNAPAGTLAGSGWEFEGKFGGFLGTAVDTHFFLTAKHIGGDTNTPFILDGTNYFPDAWYDDGGADLRLWHVPAALPRYAPVYTGTNEPGGAIVVIGRGTRRGEPVISGGLTNGWLWGSSDSVVRWGSNSVNGVVIAGGFECLYATFDHGAGPDECHLSVGDSGGSAFLLADGRWQLAGIHYSVDGYYSYTDSGVGFNAAIYDAYGLYQGSQSNWTFVTNPVAGGLYSTRVSDRYQWLTNVIPDFDSDADGMPDWWEAAYAGSIQGAMATNDVDHDGANNLAEWLAGTDPTNDMSRFTISNVSNTNGMVLTFQGSSSRYYRVYTQGELSVSTTWGPADSVSFQGADGPTSWADTNLPPAITRYYRLGVGTEPF